MKVGLKFLVFLGIFLSLFSQSIFAQKDSLGAYCSVFYVTSSNQDLLPFSDHCFLADQYSVKDPTNFRALGPVEGPISFFTQLPWSMHFYLPTAKENERLVVSTPSDLLSKNLKMNAGTMFITISDNRAFIHADSLVDNVDFAAVAGSAKVIEFVPQSGKMPYAQFKLQMDLQFRKVERNLGFAKLVGDPIRLKMVVIIDPKLD